MFTRISALLLLISISLPAAGNNAAGREENGGVSSLFINPSWSRPGAAPAADSISGVINIYARLLAFTPCPERVIVSSSAGFRPKDLALVIQMTGAKVRRPNTTNYGQITDTASVGVFEFVRIKRVEPQELVFEAPLQRVYDLREAVQVIRVPEYGDVTVMSDVTAPAWDGSTGGVIALLSNGTVTLRADIDATGKGFDGGEPSVNASFNSITDYVHPTLAGRSGLKGSGIAAALPDSNAGRGALANGGGGGNGHNAGGGGGSNAGKGGRGGNQHNGASPMEIGGFGGWALPYGAQPPRAFLGGGGGGGHQNDGLGVKGAPGGGIVIIKADAVISPLGYSIEADGAAQTRRAGNDGGGGGGGGGVIMADVRAYQNNVTLTAKGGKGGDVDNAGNSTQCHGSGGGGGGGVIWISGPVFTSNIVASVIGGAPGLNVITGPCRNTPYGALEGDTGLTLTDLRIDWNGGPPRLFTATLPDTIRICEGDSVWLNPRVNGGLPPLRYEWRPPLDPSAVVRPPVSTTYTLIVTDICDDTARASVHVKVIPLPAVSLQKKCDSLFASPPGLNYKWYRDGLRLPGDTLDRIEAGIDGVYSVRVETPEGCASLSPSLPVRLLAVTPPPGPIDICEDSCVTLRPLVGGGTAPYTYSWIPQEGMLPPSHAPTVCPDSSTSYLLTVVDACQDTVRVRIPVTVYPRPLATISRSGDTLRAEPPGMSYRWFRNDTLLPGVTSRTIVPDIPGFYSVEVTSAEGCRAMSPPERIFRFAAFLPASLAVCPDSCIVLPLQTAGGKQPLSFAWKPPSALSGPADSTPVACPDSTTLYTVIITDGDGDTASASVTVYVHPRISAIIRRSGDTLTADPEGASYRWFRDGVPIPGEDRRQLIAVVDGIYTVEIISHEGCPALSPPERIKLYLLKVPGTLTICRDSCILLSPEVQGGKRPLRMFWLPAAGLSFPTDSTASACPDSSVTYLLTVIDSESDTVTAGITVLVLPPPPAALHRRGDTLLATPPGMSYRWYRDGALLPGENSDRLLASGAGAYTVEVTSPEGCPALSNPFRIIRIELPSSAGVCPDSCVLLQPSVAGAQRPCTYLWTPAAGLSSNADSTPVACPASTTRYRLLLVDALGDSSSAEIEVAVHDVPAVTIIRIGDTLYVTPPGLRCRWHLDGNEIPGATEERIHAYSDGIYTVHATTPEGCPVESAPYDVRRLPAVLSLRCPPLSRYRPGERVEAVLSLTLPAGPRVDGPRSAEAHMRLKAGVLAPLPDTADNVIFSRPDMLIVRSMSGIPAGAAELLLPLNFIATLGNGECTEIILDSLKWIGGDMPILYSGISCEVCVEICREGGERLFEDGVVQAYLRNHPDPFNSTTIIEYGLIEDGLFELFVVDVLGRRVADIAGGRGERGGHRVAFERSGLGSGVYIAILATENTFLRSKMIIVE